jgi:hypothetical protein
LDQTANNGGGIALTQSAVVSITICVFQGCAATGSYGGGAIFSNSNLNKVDIYGTKFIGNTAVEDGGDIYNNDGAVTIHGTCPSPYESNVPTEGERGG